MAAPDGRRWMALPAGLGQVSALRGPASTAARFPPWEHDGAACSGDPEFTVGPARRPPAGARPPQAAGGDLGEGRPPAPPLGSHSSLWARRSPTPVPCGPARGYEIRRSVPEPLRVSSRKRGARRGLGRNGRLGVRAAGCRASLCLWPPDAEGRTLHFLAAIVTIMAARGMLSDRPSDSRRRQRPAARPLSLWWRPRPRIGYPVAGTAHSSSGLGRRPLTAVARVRIPYAP
jgi:hypothetical protein